MKRAPVLAVLFLAAVLSVSAAAICICQGNPASQSCKECGSGTSGAGDVYRSFQGSLTALSLECGVSEEDILKANGLPAGAKIETGTMLRIPNALCSDDGGGLGAGVDTPGLAWPVPIASSKNGISRFGEPRAGHSHAGIDIFAPVGTPINAIQDAVVARVSPTESGNCGKSVSYNLQGSGWYVLNCHMNSVNVKVGQKIKKCQKIGTVGKTGNAATTPAHDHFEIHPNGQAGSSNAVDPWPRIKNAPICPR